jgi:hypothetical protein
MAVATLVAMCTNVDRPELLKVLLSYHWHCIKLCELGARMVEFLLMLPAE